MRRPVLVLCDSDDDRVVVVRALLETLDLDIVACQTVAECLRSLATRYRQPRMILAQVHLSDWRLLPALEHWYAEQMHPLPPLLLWSQNGVRDVPHHARFIERQRALVFPLPLDVDLLVACARIHLPSAPTCARHVGPAPCCDAYWRGRRNPRLLAKARRRRRLRR